MTRFEKILAASVLFLAFLLFGVLPALIFSTLNAHAQLPAVYVNGTPNTQMGIQLNAPSCNTASSALQWDTASGFLCNSSITANTAATATYATTAGSASSASSVPASGVTGTTLASNVTASSLTSFGSSPTLVTPAISGAAGFSSYLDLTQIATPSAPAASTTRLYSTSAGLAYQLPAGGEVILVAAALSPTVQKFTSGSAQTYTPTSGTKNIRVRMVGGGGGGGAVATNSGTAGGTSSFGSWTANGGNGGAANSSTASAGGTGGTNGTGTLIVRISGQNGEAALAVGGVSGGSSVFGGGGKSPPNATAGLAAVTNTGSGGSAGTRSGTGIGAAGAAGEYVEFYVSSPGNTTYTVGAAGSGGAAGNLAGGNGAAGIIIIEEYQL